MSHALQILAGKQARSVIAEKGLNADLFKLLVGASGGPKWFVLAGLDRYFCGEFFQRRQTPLYTLGSSAGAWRFSCYAQEQPLEAINRLIDGYSHLTYAKNSTIHQVTQKSEELLGDVLGANGANEIVSNPLIKTNTIVAKSLGLTRYEPKPLQLIGLMASALGNQIHRKHLGKYYQRVIFSTDTSYVPFDYKDGIASAVVNYTQNNIKDALLATGAIPLVVNGVKHIAGAGPGMYRDGGIIDYHFDQAFLPQTSPTQTDDNDLVLYPHFYNEFKPGWFDKFVKHRFANPEHFDNVVVLAPTAEFVARLPYGKIPDRKDFTELSDHQRISYWQQVISESERLADEFQQSCENANVIDKIKPI
ncbi:patatin-like phospholipase family protein [Thalassotalea aquiviva]|uniref:patatin-like phospholipase family protein n=1 Tax=Thalassotalea aquiviva TaxID=3242415 RepID=UPI00352B4108